MIRNYLKIAFRNLVKNKVYSFINIAGLALGLACVMLIALFVKDEVSYDNFHEKGNRIYRIVQKSVNKDGEEWKSGNTGMPHAPAFAAEIPEIEGFSRLKGWDMLVKKQNEGINQLVIYAESSLFEMFSIDWLQGNKKTALDNKNSVVITEEIAIKYFNTTDAIGKVIEINQDGNFQPFTITGVVKKTPLNSSIQFDMLIPISLTDQNIDNDWMSSFQNSFVIVRPNTNPKIVERKMAKVFEKFYGKQFAEYQKNYGKTSITYLLQPFEKMHLDKDFFVSNGLKNWSNPKYSYILSGIALFILLLACINFINLTLAQSLRRGKEIGVRKVNGSTRKQLIWQFMSEVFLTTLLSFIPAISLFQLFLPKFCELTDKNLQSFQLFDYQNISIGFLLIFAITFLAGFYPSLVLSGFNPIQTLYGKFKLSGKNYFGKALVVAQFAIAILFINGTFILQRQFDFLTTKDLGYETKNILSFEIPFEKAGSLVQPFKNELSKLPYVQQVSATNWGFNKTGFEIDGKKTDWTYHQKIDENFLKLFKIPLAAGRTLSFGFPADTASNCMINEAFAKEFGWKEPLGKTIKWQNKNYSVVGVTKDYHNASLHEKIEPIFLYMKNDNYNFQIYMKVANGKMPDAVASVREIFKKLVPFIPFASKTYEQFLNEKYAEEETWRQIISWSSLITIFIACLGLFGLASLSIEQRFKEIGIRKVLGASVLQISSLLSKNFFVLIIIAFLIAIPIALHFGNNWLKNFAYRINIDWWMFLISGALVSLIALLTVSYQAIKAALMNPVKSLKTE